MVAHTDESTVAGRRGQVDLASGVAAEVSIARADSRSARRVGCCRFESLLIDDAEEVLEKVRRFKALGVCLSIDDFGTGYSSLAYLKRFAVDKLKIDQSFVRDIASDPDDAAIVRAIISMARSLKLKVIAEGVETAELARFLRLYHCHEAQGFHYAKPMPADAFAQWLLDYQASA